MSETVIVAIIGVTGTLLGSIIGFFGNSILEKRRVKNDGRIHISKTRFDMEFETYQSLSKSFFETVKAITIMIPPLHTLISIPADEGERKELEETQYRRAQNETVIAQDILNSNAPFITEELYKKYDELLSLCKKQLSAYSERWKVDALSKTVSREDHERSSVIQNKYDELNRELRNYLSKLEIMK